MTTLLNDTTDKLELLNKQAEALKAEHEAALKKEAEPKPVEVELPPVDQKVNVEELAKAKAALEKLEEQATTPTEDVNALKQQNEQLQLQIETLTKSLGLVADRVMQAAPPQQVTSNPRQPEPMKPFIDFKTLDLQSDVFNQWNTVRT